MRTSILSLVFFVSFCSFAQNSQFKEVKKSNLNQFIGSILEYKNEHLKNNNLKLFITANSVGSLKSNETEEVTQNLYVSNCEDGETLNCKLYLAKNYVNIKIEAITEDAKNIYIEISSGMQNNRKKEKLTLSL